MNNPFMPGEIYAWYTPGQIFFWLQQQRYQVYNILYDGQWYVVEARDPDGTWVELKVTPKTRTVCTWKFLEETWCSFWLEEEIAQTKQCLREKWGSGSWPNRTSFPAWQ